MRNGSLIHLTATVWQRIFNVSWILKTKRNNNRNFFKINQKGSRPTLSLILSTSVMSIPMSIMLVLSLQQIIFTLCFIHLCFNFTDPVCRVHMQHSFI